MPQTPLKPPSTGALRLLRWLALYGSFGTAAGATAFVLDEQRRQICRLSRIRDNGKKLREFMHRRDRTQTCSSTATYTPSHLDFHEYVYDLESRGVVKKELATQNGRPGIERAGLAEYHYGIRARGPSTSKSRPKGDGIKKKDSPTPNEFALCFCRTFSTSNSLPRQRYRHDMRRLATLPQPPTLGYFKAQTKKNFESRLPSERTKAQSKEDAIKDILLVAARSGDLETVGTLLNTCEADLSWSKYLYSSFLTALDFIAVSVKPTPSNASFLFSLGQRILEKNRQNPTGRIQFFYEAGAFPLVLAAYQYLPVREWTSGFRNIILDSTLRVAAMEAGRSSGSGADLLQAVTDVLQQTPKDAEFLRTFPALYRQASASSGYGHDLDLIILQSIEHMCGQNAPDMLQIVEMVLKRVVEVGTRHQVTQLFRRYFYLETAISTLRRCWSATIQSSTEDEITSFLDFIQEQSNTFSDIHLENLRAALLRQTWKCLHNFDRVQALFEHIDKFRNVESRRAEAGILSNTMIDICAKAGRWEEAKQYVWDARHLNFKAKVQLTDAGFHYETILLARRGQWAIVKRKLEGAQKNRTESTRAELFLDVLRIFSQHNQAQDVLDFFRWAVSNAGVSATQHVFDIIISSCLVLGNQQIMSKTLGLMKDLNFQWRIRAETVVMTFRMYATAYKPRSVHFMRCLEGLRTFPQLLSKDVCLVLMEHCSVTARRLRFVGRERLHLMQQRSQLKLVEQVTRLETLASTATWISQQKDARPQETGNPLLERAQAYYVKMQVASSLQQWQEVVVLFEDSIRHNIPRLELPLCLAVKACLELDDPESGADLIRNAQALGFNTVKAEGILTSRSGRDSEVSNPRDLREGVLRHYEYMQSRFLPLDHGQLVQAAHIMVLKSQAAASVALLSEVYQSPIAKMQPFDIVAMTCFLTAYSCVFDMNGIRWVVRTILSNKLLLDIHFFRSLAQARVRVCASLKRDGQRRRSTEVSQLFRIWDMLCWRRFEKQQQNVIISGRVMTNMLVRLHTKDSPLNRFLTNRVRIRKLYNRETARSKIQARLQRTRSGDEKVRARITRRAGWRKGRVDEPSPQAVYANRGDWTSWQYEPSDPPSIGAVADAVATLLDPEMDMTGVKESPLSMTLSNDLKTRYEYKNGKYHPQRRAIGDDNADV
ncbi:hypothetical protein FKW77_007633 [Venturia effusa]|uniref:Uncharacterized protein n=1 Tax=Venturia effusa TaxID=50376 RepID=A0A517LHL2_9PEZI|nr:hypothetical protein FKW77_007633 [Venturia effusa]